jgi:uncharacterized protein (TIGR00369 family)
MTTGDSSVTSGEAGAGVADVLAAFVEHSPFAAHLGMRPEVIEADHVRIAMPFKDRLATAGDVVHGGAISSLVDTAATIAAWSGLESLDNARGTTISLTVTFVAAARGRDLVADAHVVRRGKTICFCAVDVLDSEQTTVAQGLVTYKLG